MTEEELKEYFFKYMEAGREKDMRWPNYMDLLKSPTFRWKRYFKIYADMRKGGLGPTKYPAFEKDVEDSQSFQGGLVMMARSAITEKYGLVDVAEADVIAMQRQLAKEADESAEQCWHPNAGPATCDMTAGGKPKITNAHSLQNSKVLQLVAPKGNLMTIDRISGGYDGVKVGRFQASTFRGMCNTHDRIFKPIEDVEYSGTDEQHFLHAYRAFLHSMHNKLATSYYIDYGPECVADDQETRRILNDALLSGAWDTLETAAFKLPAMYPLAASGSYYLEFDYEAQPIVHGESRMEFVYTTLLPRERDTLFLFSYLKQDAHLYRKVGEQLRMQPDQRSGITALVAPHTENIFYEPEYFAQFIAPNADDFMAYMHDAQDGFALRDKTTGKVTHEDSHTPPNYLQNPRRLTLFGY